MKAQRAAATIDKERVYRQLDNTFLAAVSDYLHSGFLVVLVGATGSGKTVLANKALPTAKVVSGLDGGVAAASAMDSDMIGEELHGMISTTDTIRCRDRALALGHKVIFTAQMWQDIVPHLAGLEQRQYKVFDLNRVWEVAGRSYPLPNPIPQAVLAN